MDDVKLIDFDEVALGLQDDAAAVDDDDDDSLIIAHVSDSDDLSQLPSTDAAAALTPTSLPDDVASRCSSESPSPPFDEIDEVQDGDSSQQQQEQPVAALPPVSAILPPLRPLTSDLPAPEVSTGDGSDYDNTVTYRFNGRAAMGLGSSQLVVGLSCVALGLAALITRVSYGSVGAGIWGGLMCMACGTIGIHAYRAKTEVRIACYLAASVMSSACSIAIFVVSTLACSEAELSSHDSCHVGSCSPAQVTASLVINLMLCVVSMVDLTVCMCSVALALRAFCKPTWCTCNCCYPRPASDSVAENNMDNFPWLCLYNTSSTDDAAPGNFRLWRQPPPYSPAEAPPPYAPSRPAHDRNK